MYCRMASVIALGLAPRAVWSSPPDCASESEAGGSAREGAASDGESPSSDRTGSRKAVHCTEGGLWTNERTN
jgi:hypothetical protein